MNDANEDFRTADAAAELNQLDTQTMDVLAADLDDPNAPSGIPMSDILVAREPELEFTPKPERPKQVKARNELLTDFGKRTLLDRYDRGLPISCFLNAVDDSLDSIVDVWNENVYLASWTA